MSETQAPAIEPKTATIADAAAEAGTVNGGSKATNGDEQTNVGAPSTTAADMDSGNGPVTEVKAANGETTEVAAADAEGTEQAVDSKATPNKSRRKSAGGVPEHKSKKLNKKKSMPVLNLDLEPGDYVWARLKGHPAWPSIICDEAMLPESLLGARPVSAKRPDGTYREDFLDGGKNVRDRKYPVMFLHTNEFAWMVNSSLARLDRAELDKDDGGKKPPALKAAYELAAESHDLDFFKDVLRKHEEELKEYEKELHEKEEQRAAQAAEKEKKKAEQSRRKSKAADDAMDVDEDGKPSKKRKKEAESEGEGKPKKTPKVKLTAGKDAKDSAAKSKPKKKTAKAEEAAPELTEAEKLDRREKAVFYIRHKLQKSLLSSQTPPADDEMPTLAEHFTQLEQYKDLEPHLIRKTKIHKVLKNIVRLDSVPRDEEFGFKKRSAEMLNHWNSVLATTAEAETPVVESKPAINGEAKAQETGNGAEGAKGTPKAPEENKEPSTGAAPATAGDADITMADASVSDVKADKPSETGAAAAAGGDTGAPKTEAEPPKTEAATNGAETTVA